MRISYAIVGGGIIGLAVAHRLLRRQPGARAIVFEKENQPGQHQSAHNSGVLHAGLYYKPGSLKARLAVTGVRQMRAFCQEHGVAHETCGKLVVAVSPDELPRLKELIERGTANGLVGLKWMDAAEMREIEPHVAGIAAVRVPEEGIADYPAVCRQLLRLVNAEGGQVRLGTLVHQIQPEGNGWRVNGEPFDYLINCAGLHSDRVLAMAGERRTTRIVPFRGEYFLMNPEGARLVKHLIYPVPDPKFPFLGVHFTRMIAGGVECGPNAVLATRREGYHRSDFSLADVVDVFSFPGFWRFFAKYPAMAAYELRRSLDRAEFCRSLQRLVPEVRLEHLTPGHAGVRAQGMAEDGTLIQDFDIVQRTNSMHVVNAPSPGATSSLAIADYLLDRVTQGA